MDLEVLPHLVANGEGLGYAPINAQVFHTTITEKYYGSEEEEGAEEGEEEGEGRARL